MCLVMWPRYVLKATSVTSHWRLRWFSQPNTQLIISVIKNWKSAAGREPVGSDNNTPTCRPSSFRTDPVGSAEKVGFLPGERRRRTLRLDTPTLLKKIFYRGIKKAGDTKRPAAKHVLFWSQRSENGRAARLVRVLVTARWQYMDYLVSGSLLVLWLCVFSPGGSLLV